MRVTANNIAKAVKAETGIDVELVTGDGYYWFASVGGINVLDYAPTTSVYVTRMSDFSVERWVEEFKGLIEGVEVPEKLERNEDGTYKPIVLQSFKNVY